MRQRNKATKIAVAQVTPVFLNKTKTVQKACDTILEAGSNGAKMLVFPEAFISGYPDWIWLIPNSKGAVLNELYIELVENSISVSDQYTAKLCKAAKQAGIFVVIGINEKNSEASGSSLYNTLLFINGKGEITGKHRKLIPTGGERLIWARGDGKSLNVYDTYFGKVGGLICWENYMPLARQALYDKGVQILTIPTWDKSDRWLGSLNHIAREGGSFVVNCCMPLRIDDIPDRYEFKKLYPEGREWINSGNSCIISPKGEYIVGPVKEKEAILYGDIELTQIIESKRMFDVSGHYSRPDVFNLKVMGE